MEDENVLLVTSPTQIKNVWKGYFEYKGPWKTNKTERKLSVSKQKDGDLHVDEVERTIVIMKNGRAAGMNEVTVDRSKHPGV